MANFSCSSCEDLRNTDPSLFANGLGEQECASLANDTGLVATDDHDDCTDLHDMNDCLVGNMAKEIDAESNCEWKPFVKNLIKNSWTVLTAMICAICGIWENIHAIWEEIEKLWAKVNCVYNGLKNLINALNNTTQGQAFVRYFRDNSVSDQDFMWNISEGSEHTLDIYMDANGAYAGSQNADRDYIVMISNCTDIDNTSNVGIYLTYYSSEDASVPRTRQSQHPNVHLNGAKADRFSWTTSGAVLIRSGHHVKVNAKVYTGSSGKYRVHQFVLTWIPVNAGNSSLDPSTIIPC